MNKKILLGVVSIASIIVVLIVVFGNKQEPTLQEPTLQEPLVVPKPKPKVKVNYIKAKPIKAKSDFKFDSGILKFSRKEFHGAKGQKISKKIVFNKHIDNVSFMRTIKLLDINPGAKVDITVSDLTSKGCNVNLHLSKDVKQYWTMHIHWLAHNSRSHTQTGQYLVNLRTKAKITKNVYCKFNTPFKVVPKVTTFLTGFNSSDPSIKLKVIAVSKFGFTVQINKWRGSNYDWLKIDWIASSKPDCVASYWKGCWKTPCSDINTTKNKKHRHFTYTWPFKTTRNTRIVGLQGIDINPKAWIRINLESNKNKNTTYQTWANSENYAVHTGNINL